MRRTNDRAIMFHIGIAVQHPPLPDPSQLSELGIDFIKQCLTIDPDERPTAVQLMSHPWIEQFKEDLDVAFEEETGSNSSNVGSSSLGWNSNATTNSSISGPVLEEDEEGEEEEYNAGNGNVIDEREEEEQGGYNGGAELENTSSEEKEEEEREDLAHAQGY